MEKTRRVPVLGWVMSLYYCQGLPFSLVRQVAVVFFKDQGVSLQSLGFVSLYGIPWTFKFFWGPLIDSKLTKRRWILLMELTLGATLGVISLLMSQHVGPSIIAAGFLAVAFVAATHDIAIDGFYLAALDKEGQAKYSGWWQAGYRLALLTGSGLLVALSAIFSWWIIFLIPALFFILMTFWHRFLLPYPEERKIDETSKVKIVEGFQTFLEIKGIGLAIAFILLFKIGDALLFGMSTPFLLDAGLTKAKLGLYSGAFGVTAGISAAIFAGWFISRFSLRKGLYIFGIIQNFAIPLFAYIAWTKPAPWVLGLSIVVEQLCAGLGAAAYGNFMMRQINPQYKATHYAICSGIMALTTSMAGIASGYGAQHYGYAIFFSFAFFASIPGLLLIPLVARRPECS